ncbi:MAG: ferrochelatase [Sulfuricurvum sp.]|uniref:ferrochelatase n=1 Tax=Sulfuricurvum sp. TaxID=2025608 RepID=UPI0026371EE7|nr:ferrochelatase [Sulfuricurvum sp.]MDD2829033.1 ferrochelatase [Sulfuricurvum sp.]MDD4949680.1 ferrochelatase [Sulfuricurvum sp.]
MKEAIVLLNMGGPNNLAEVETFLTNMFNDPAIIRTKSSLMRRFIAGVITLSRAEKSQEIYRQIGGKSPIVDLTKSLVQKLAVALNDSVMVDFVMRYTPPMAEEVVLKLKSAGVQKVYLIPLYPQYSSTTTQSSIDDFEMVSRKIGWFPIIVEIKHFFTNHTYNSALLSLIKECLNTNNADEFDLIFSAHGLPQKIVDDGDPYQRHVSAHVELLKNLLIEEGIHFKGIYLAYQSKVGPMKWLEPSLESALRGLENKKVIIVPIAFTIDNSETDFELSIEYAEIAHELGYNDYRVCRCPNDHPLFVETLKALYEKMR